MDVKISNHGSIIMVAPITEAARAWVDENLVLEGWQWLGAGFACEPRYLDTLVEGMTEAGLEVRR